MSLLLQLIILVVGFVILIKGADIFVDGASSTASNWKVPKILIGLTIVAFGTSAPELAVSIKALASGANDIVLGNVIGSNILNILLILGVGALVRPLLVHKETVRAEIPMCILVTMLLIVLLLDSVLSGASDNMLTRSDGIAILLFFAVFLYYLIQMAMRSRSKDAVETPKWSVGKSLLFTGLGLAGIIFGSNFVVDSATEIAHILGISERVISLSVIALGTSLPELVTTIVAARKNETDLVIGNILGSNIFNICIVLGLPIVIFGGISSAAFTSIDLIALAASALFLFIFSWSQHRIARAEGAVLLTAFIAYYTVVFVF